MTKLEDFRQRRGGERIEVEAFEGGDKSLGQVVQNGIERERRRK